MTLSLHPARAAQRPSGRTRCNRLDHLLQLHATRLEPSCALAQKGAPARTMPAVICFPSLDSSPNSLVMTAGKVRAYPKRRKPLSAGRVRGWRLGRRLSIPVAPRFLWECLTSPHHILVPIPCHLEPDVRFSLIRLSDSLLLAAFKVMFRIFLADRSTSNHFRFSRTSCQARHSISGRYMRSYSAWNRRFLLLLAAKYSPRWSSRDLSVGVIGSLGACTVTYLLARHD